MRSAKNISHGVERGQKKLLRDLLFGRDIQATVRVRREIMHDNHIININIPGLGDTFLRVKWKDVKIERSIV